jgi:hypothetical protein
MNSERCEFEDAIGAAIASGQWDGALREHLAQHVECAELEITLRCLANIGTADDQAPPGPGLIWWRAQLAERRAQAMRGVAAIEWMQRAAMAAAVIGFIAIWQPANFVVSTRTLLLGGTMLAATCAVLYGWAKART